MIALFSQHESRDELGIGQIRDVFSDTLFPGTSVVQTRARYFLIVPWVFSHAARRGRSGAQLHSLATNTERQLIDTFLSAGHTDGLIGKVAGSRVKILPSSIYWSGLQAYGILTHSAGPERLAGGAGRSVDSADELAVRVVGDWDPSLPPMPADFLQLVPGGLDLAPNEALWLRDRMLAAAPGTLLAHLLVAGEAPNPDSPVPWLDTVAVTAPAPARAMLWQAAMFSIAMHGAALLYNLLIAERYEAAGFTKVVAPVEWYRRAFASWTDEIADHAGDLQQWDRATFWEHALDRNSRIALPTRAFVNQWTDAVLDGTAEHAPDSPHLRSLVAERERKIKGSQSRLVNDKLLASWAGESGAGLLSFRWRQVRRMATDIHSGLDPDAAS